MVATGGASSRNYITLRNLFKKGATCNLCSVRAYFPPGKNVVHGCCITVIMITTGRPPTSTKTYDRKEIRFAYIVHGHSSYSCKKSCLSSQLPFAGHQSSGSMIGRSWPDQPPSEAGTVLTHRPRIPVRTRFQTMPGKTGHIMLPISLPTTQMGNAQKPHPYAQIREERTIFPPFPYLYPL